MFVDLFTRLLATSGQILASEDTADDAINTAKAKETAAAAGLLADRLPDTEAFLNLRVAMAQQAWLVVLLPELCQLC